MISISCDVKGIKNAIEKAVLSGVVDNVKKTVGSVRCKEHGKAPKIKIKGNNLNNLSFEVDGCCEEVIEQVKKKLK
ncbi:hypothetical protein ACFSJQ_21130 [Vibrio olivae]|uniref:Uncharacterized protein n=1 Tax=Vibrio olivae TaxID=1243002 RepID=A0ABV5HLZ9_9VIBR|nr:hypothetical protein [Vibrio parahaemolyticus]